MVAEQFSNRISDDWLWREKELRAMDSMLVKSQADIEIKSAILLVYSHWEGHFKVCASELLDYIQEGIRRKIFNWTNIRDDVRQRILFCSYRRSSLTNQTHETFISYLNALNDARYIHALKAKDEIIMIDDNLNSLRAEAICRNLGVEHAWCALKKIIIDDRILDHRNAIAHGARRLRSGDVLDLSNPDIIAAISELRILIRDAKDRFSNAIAQQKFLKA